MENIDKLDLLDARLLLKEAVAFINGIPNGKYEAFPYKDSYELASEIDKYLKRTNDSRTNEDGKGI